MRKTEYAVAKFDSARSFLDACQEWLLESGVANNSLVSVVLAISSGKTGFGTTHWFGSVMEDEAIRGCAVYEQLDGLMTTPIPEGGHELLANSLTEEGLEIKKVYGPEHDSKVLAQILTRNDSREWNVTHRWDCYAAKEIEHPVHAANGDLRKPRDNERGTIEDWAEEYAAEMPAPIPVKDFLLRKMQDGDLYLWDNLGPKTMLSISKVSPLCARISSVFTPQSFRGRGYASAAVATLSSQLLEQGHAYTSLTVETDALHLHRMYRRLGFEKHDSRLNIVLS